MPIWPLPPLVALAGLVVVATQQTLHDVGIVAAFVVAALIYYVVYLRGKHGTRWVMLEPTTAETEALSEPSPGPAGPI